MKIAVILAAGRGSRINKITKFKPKTLISLWGKTLLQRQIEILSQYKSVKKIYVITGYKKKIIENICMNYKNVETVHNKTWSSSNMVTSLSKIKNIPFKTVIISYGDIFYPRNFLNKIVNNKKSISILYDREWIKLWKKRFINYWDDAESFNLDKKNIITSIGLKLNKNDKPKGQFIGIIKMNKIGWFNFINTYYSLDTLKRQKIDFTSFLNQMIKNKKKVYGIATNLKWGEIDNFKDLQFYKREFSKKYFS